MAALDDKGLSYWAEAARARIAQPLHYDPEHYERELRALWYRNWIYLCRASTLPDRNPFALFRSAARASSCCVTSRASSAPSTIPAGTRLGALRGVRRPLPGKVHHLPLSRLGPYDLRGKLAGVHARGMSDDFDRGDFPLYDVALVEWGGFVFINLGGAAVPLEATMRPNSERLGQLAADDARLWPRLAQAYIFRGSALCARRSRRLHRRSCDPSA